MGTHRTPDLATLAQRGSVDFTVGVTCERFPLDVNMTRFKAHSYHDMLSHALRVCLDKKALRSSSVVEQSAVNRPAVGSNPTCGASFSPKGMMAASPRGGNPVARSVWVVNSTHRTRIHRLSTAYAHLTE